MRALIKENTARLLETQIEQCGPVGNNKPGFYKLTTAGLAAPSEKLLGTSPDEMEPPREKEAQLPKEQLEKKC